MRVLLVDDEPDIIAFYREVAESEGYTQVDSVGTGEEALARVLWETYDLIVLDICMPGVSGLEIIFILRNMCPHALIAIVSGYIPEDVPSDVIECADVLLSKPIGVDLLGELLAGATEMSLTLARIRLMGDISLVLDGAAGRDQTTTAGPGN